MRRSLVDQKGFTLIEVVSTLVIVGILSAIATPKYVDLTGQAGRAAASANADSLVLSHATSMGLNAASNPSSPYPTLEGLVGASGQVRPPVPSGWTSSSAPPASVPLPPILYTYSAEVSTMPFYYCNLHLGQRVSVDSDNINAFAADFINTTNLDVNSAQCLNDLSTIFAFRVNSYTYELVSATANAGDLTLTYREYINGGLYTQSSRSVGGATSSSGGVCDAGYTASGSTCNLTDASAVSCPAGYTRSGSSCSLTNPADAGTPGRLPLALNNSGVCVGPALKAAAWTDQARTTTTGAAGSTVRQIDASPISDATNCPASLFP